MARNTKKKTRKTGNAKTRASNRHRIIGHVVKAAALITIVICGVDLAIDNDETGMQHVHLTDAASARSVVNPFESVPDLRERFAEIEDNRREHLDVLRSVAAGDPFGEELIELLEQRTFYSIFMGGGVTSFPPTVVENPSGTPPILEITVANDRELRENGMLETSMQYMRSRRQLVIPDSGDFTDAWLGLGLAHELSHAHDHLVSRIEPTNGTSRSYMEGERRAYEHEFRFFNRLTGGRAEELVNEVARHFRDRRGYFDLARHNHPLLDELLALPEPARSDEESRVRGGLVMVVINFRIADLRGGGVEEKLRFLTALHSSTGMPLL